MKVSIIANPASGRGRGRRFIEDFRASARAVGLEAAIMETMAAGDATRIARERAGDSDVVCIIGGDGTVHEVVNGVMSARDVPCPIAVLPAGTGNDFASLVRGPGTARELLEALERGTGARLDVLDFGDGGRDRFCANSAGLGFEGIVNEHSHDIKGIHGPLLYLIAVFKALSSLECPHYRIKTSAGHSIDGRQLLVSVGNGNRTGGAFYLTPDALPDDGLIDLCIVREMGPVRVVGLLPRTFRGGHVNRREVKMLRVESVTIETEGVYPMHVDGELVERTPARLDITVRRRVLPVLCDADPKNHLRHGIEKVL